MSALANKDTSFDEAFKHIEEFKKWATVKNVFLNEMQVDNWTEAEQKFPCHAKKEKLLKFKLSKSKSMPMEFMVRKHGG